MTIIIIIIIIIQLIIHACSAHILFRSELMNRNTILYKVVQI